MFQMHHYLHLVYLFIAAYLQIDMFGPTLMAIRSYQTGEYICHNLSTGYVEVKVRNFWQNLRLRFKFISCVEL